MTHFMKLMPFAFTKIADGHKTIELRLNDEKRSKIKVGDTVVFNCIGNFDVIFAKVDKLHVFSDFAELYAVLPLEKCGYTADELKNAHHSDMERFYNREQIEKYGALGIELTDVQSVCDVKEKLFDSDICALFAPSIFNPTEERINNRTEKYANDKNIHVYAFKEGVYKAVIAFCSENKTATVLDIATKSEFRNNGIATNLINHIFAKFAPNMIIAETDDDAIDFYLKYGFRICETSENSGTKRYKCICENTAHHYDLLISEGNDPVFDPEPLRQYMQKWDGQIFIDAMQLTPQKTVLEIGVGTGRIALLVAPACEQFCGVDISHKTVEKAKENLADFKNVTLICDDFYTAKFNMQFDVIYSSLTFMHLKDKTAAIEKVAKLLNNNGRFVLSIDKNQDKFIDMGTRKIEIFPDNVADIQSCVKSAGLKLCEQFETEFAHIIVATVGESTL